MSAAEPTGAGTIVYRKHWAILLRATLVPLVAVVVTLWAGFQVQQVGAAYLETNLWIWLILGGLPLLAVGWLLWRIGDWRNDIYILSDDRIVDEERLPLGFRTERREAALANVQNVTLRIPNPLAASLGFGDVVVETAGQGGGIVFRSVANPRRVLDEVSSRIEAVRARSEARARQERHQELLDWFSAHQRLERLQIVSSPPQVTAGATFEVEWRLGGVSAPVATRLWWDFVSRPDQAYRHATLLQDGGSGNYTAEMRAPLGDRLYVAAMATVAGDSHWSLEAEIAIAGFDLSYPRVAAPGEKVVARWRCRSPLDACRLAWQGEAGGVQARVLGEGGAWSATFVMPETKIAFRIEAQAFGVELWSPEYEIGLGAVADETEGLTKGA